MPLLGKNWGAMLKAGIVVAIGFALFLLNVSVGSAPRIDSESSWTEVLAWAAVNHVQWGKDIAYTYGPLGFLTPYYHHVPGAFAPFLLGQLLLAAAFGVTAVAVLRRASVLMLLFFAFALVCAFPWMRGDTAWILTMVFGATGLVDCSRRRPDVGSWMLLALFAFVSACIAQIKFSVFPVWLLCACALALQTRERRLRHAIVVFSTFLAAFVVVWVVARQSLGNLAVYLWTSMEVAMGYSHAMGLEANPAVAAIGVLCALWLCFSLLCALWHFRRDVPSAAIVALYGASSALAWRLGFTRADHAPLFFACCALIPIGILSYGPVAALKPLRLSLTLLAIVGALASLYDRDLGNMPSWNLSVAAERFGQNLSSLTSSLQNQPGFLLHLADRGRTLKIAWDAAAKENDLPLVRSRIGSDRVDVFTMDQGIALLNHLNYAPRPVFQSYLAYTPALARMNESYLLGTNAPKFALLRLEAIDNRLPMSEDGLAMIALMSRYRPVLKENGFVLLQRDSSTRPAETTVPGSSVETAPIGADIPIDGTGSPTIAFVRLDLTWLGKLYAFLVREPPVMITLTFDHGYSVTRRLVRPTAASGFLISPYVESNDDWTRMYLSMPLPDVQNFRLSFNQPWAHWLFKENFEVALHSLDILHGDPSSMSSGGSLVYPGFNLMPEIAHGYTHTFSENGNESAGFQSPATLLFSPQPSTYDVIGTFGIQGGAFNPGCRKANADGAGFSLIMHHSGVDSILWHEELDPFHNLPDKGPHQFRVSDVDISVDDTIEFHIDAGHGGSNLACDWIFVRNFSFLPNSGSPQVSKSTRD